MNDNLTFGYWVRRQRKALDLTQTELARLVFCSLSTIKKIELDERRPSRQMAGRLAESFRLEGAEREKFLAVANAELAFDRLNPPAAPNLSRAAATNLSSYQAPTPFVGYQEELAQITSLLEQPDCRLITLVGPGGIGKTRLAIQAASGLQDRYSDGVFFVPLAQLDAHAYIPTAILDALSIYKPPVSNLRAYLLETLRDKNMLLVLDNFEHLLTGVDLVVEITRSAQRVVLLVTSRVPLNLRQEQVLEMKGMTFPPAESSEDGSAYDAVKLFIQTAKRISSGFFPTREDMRSIANLCRVVEGMPLAIELAASWCRTHSCAEIEAEIGRSLDFLSSKMVDVPERHRSIRAAFDLSWKLLSDGERNLLAALSVFRGGFSRQAAEVIAGADESTLVSLVAKSLVRRAASSRFDLHELLKRYAEEKLADPAAAHRLHAAHLAYYLKIAEAKRSLDQGGEAYPAPAFADELANFRSALGWAIGTQAVEPSLRLAVALGRFWYEYGYLREGIYWLNQVLEADTVEFPAYRAAALTQSAKLLWSLGNYRQSIRVSKESLSICKRIKDRCGVGLSLLNLGIICYLNGNYPRGARLLNKSLAIFREVGDEEHQSEALLRLGDVSNRQEKFDEASGLFEKALEISTKLGNLSDIGFSLGGLGDTRRLQGKFREAIEYFKKALTIHWEQNHRVHITFVLEALGLDYAAIGFQEQAAILWGAAERLREQIHSPIPPSYQTIYKPTFEATRRSLGEADFLDKWNEGKSTALDQIFASMLGLAV